MPFDTVGGLPPIPTQARGATLYHPRQSQMLICARRRERVAASATARLPFHSTDHPEEHAEGGEERDSALPPLSAAASSSQALVAYAFNDAFRSNPWRQRTTLDALEVQQRRDPHGVARFRPVLQASEDAVRNPANEFKPLLEPYLYAQELAREVMTDTWQLRCSRYLQWLRKGAATALEAREVYGGPRCRPECHGKRNSTVAALCTGEDFSSSTLLVLDAAGKSVLDNLCAGTSSTTPIPPSLLPSSSPVALPDIKSTVSHTHASASVWQTTSRPNGASLLRSGTNPNELAVRFLFQEAHMTAATAAADNTVAALSYRAPADEIVEWLSVRRTSGGRRRLIPLPLMRESAEALVNGDAHPLPSRHSGADGAEVDTEAFAAVASASGAASAAPPDSLNYVRNNAELTRFDSENAESDEAEYVNASNPTVVLPSEYDLADVLRNRMHRAVAIFTPSSEHTLDAPPTAAKAHTIMGKVRLSTNASVQALLVSAAKSERDSGAATGGEAYLAQPASFASRNPARLLRRFLYEEEYERDLLRQLALQSSPARWYSTLLPSGKDGIRFRLLHPPTMADDAAVRRRLHGAVLQAAETIAQPRRDAAAAEEARHHPILLGRNKRSDDHSSCGANERFTVQKASREKAVLFTKWTSLHATLSAQLCLVTEEAEQRRVVLGEFLSCTHPAPCACLDLDLEVLAMSAVQLEPTVKTTCWFASVVLGRHQDTLQQELLARYQAEHDHLYSFFKVEFFALYCHQKLVADEARRFGQMIQYHQFCLRVAASREDDKKLPHREGSREEIAVTSARSPFDSAACTPEQTALPVGAGDSAATPGMHLTVLCHGDSRMRLLRLRRLRYCAAFDSPFFSYLVYTELLGTAAAEEEVRGMLMAAEVDKHAELKSKMMAEEALVRLRDSECLRRARIDAEREEAHNAMFAGPVVQLHAARVAEVRAVQAAAYATSCEEARQRFAATAVAEKMAAEEAEMDRYRPFLREMRQQMLALQAAGRSAAQSETVLREWLDRQQHMSLFSSEQRLRDRIAMLEEADARVRITAAAEASLRQARHLEARRWSEEANTANEAAQRARDSEAAALLVQLQREEFEADLRKRRSADMRAGNVNSFFTLATALGEDFEAFLPSLSNGS
ncbi:hypothetical protein GH5_03999 [Leishmania sp. Ghana 2012 LV757]|uniref:hypothetical protein n=1 Tax=Leishmania sp. Ghana 2012 LV757 TaxID=2803181 RepID=UPI001B3E6EF9|nr:hypothetical protein GH5_03999 [Leishmania sp. Ghana 2012 LV757]